MSKDYTIKVHNLQSLSFLRNCRLNVGILGGSFNPAHIGHLQISHQALKVLQLDYLIWLVALQNPFKFKYKHDIFLRAAQAAEIVEHPKILVATAESDIGSYNTYNSLKRFKELFKGVNFTFLMGADNINSFHKWYRYKDIADLCSIVVFDRPNILGHLNFNKFTMNFKVNIKSIADSPLIDIGLKSSIDKKQTNNIIIYRGVMSEMSSTLIRHS
ncbi:MAG: nicotinate-nicotinamide nucleotide adenylyltransferase [Rickettsia endosymbiont of Bryobia graminum]|nr:nicotinate-nicotinamide nucleotide adenylyltransferase [Rickettsia endosymbiont of Bryobia graminum]